MKVKGRWNKISFLLILVLLVSMMPILSMAGTEEEEQLKEETPTRGINVELFNYGRNINQYTDDSGFGFFGAMVQDGNRNVIKDSVDNRSGESEGSGDVQRFKNTLNNAGYPELKDNNYSLEYLFNPSDSTDANQTSGQQALTNYQNRYQNNGNYTRKHFDVNEDDNGLFTKDDDGNFVYSSADNSAWFNPTTKQFELSENLIAPYYVGQTSAVKAEHENFLPFNKAHPTKSKFYTHPGNSSKTVGTTLSRSTINAQGSGITSAEDRATYCTDLWFGMTVDFNFMQPIGGKVQANQTADKKDMIFEFQGDDDVIVYIDGVKILDMSGCHAAQKGTINFATGVVDNRNGKGGGELTTIKKRFQDAGKDVSEGFKGNTFADYSTHDFKFYYLERGGNISFCSLKYNIPVVEYPVPLTVKKEVSEADQATLGSDTLYHFELLDDFSSSKLTHAASKSFAIYEGNKYIGESSTDNSGRFSLAAGQEAVFEYDIAKVGGKPVYYQVNELHAGDSISDIGQVDVVNYSGGQTNKQVFDYDEFSLPNGTRVGTDDSQSILYTSAEVTFTNYPRQEFSFTKTVSAREGLTVPNETFNFEVYIGTSTTPYVGQYKLNDSTKLVDWETGIIPVEKGDTVTIENLRVGTEVTVKEVDSPAHFTPVAKNGEQSLVTSLSGSNHMNFVNNYTIGELDVVKTNNPTYIEGPVKAGEEITYKITATNNGDDDLTGVWIRDYIPEHTEYVSGSATQSGEYIENSNGGYVDWFIDTISTGASVDLVFKVTVQETIDTEDITYEIQNAALYENTDTTESAIGSESDPELETKEVKNPIGRSLYKVLKTGTPSLTAEDNRKVQQGDTIDYTITVTNTGNVPLENIKVWDDIPLYTEFSSGGGIWSWNETANRMEGTIAELDVEETVTLTFQVTVGEYPNGWDITNIAYHGTGGGDPQNPTDEVVTPTLTRSYNLIKIQDHADELNAGETVTYTMYMANTGETDLKNITVKDAVPEYTTYVLGSADDSGGVFDPLTNTITWTIDELKASGDDVALSEPLSFTVMLNEGYPEDHIVPNIALAQVEGDLEFESNKVENPTGPVYGVIKKPKYRTSSEEVQGVLGQPRTGDDMNTLSYVIVFIIASMTILLAAVTRFSNRED